MAVELIAEVSSNHGGHVPLAKEFIKRFAAAGADWVKFQTTRVAHLNPVDPQYTWFMRAELSDDAHAELKACCEAEGTKFLTTVYNAAEVPMLKALGLRAIKIGSGEAGEPLLAKAVRQNFDRILVSTGLSNPFNGESPFYGCYGVQWLHCVTHYPCPPWLAVPKKGYSRGFRGWSDHCVGLDGCRYALIAGAQIIEKHVQLGGQARPAKDFEATVDEWTALRQLADEADPKRFLKRWQYA